MTWTTYLPHSKRNIGCALLHANISICIGPVLLNARMEITMLAVLDLDTVTECSVSGVM